MTEIVNTRANFELRLESFFGKRSSTVAYRHESNSRLTTYPTTRMHQRPTRGAKYVCLFGYAVSLIVFRLGSVCLPVRCFNFKIVVRLRNILCIGTRDTVLFTMEKCPFRLANDFQKTRSTCTNGGLLLLKKIHILTFSGDFHHSSSFFFYNHNV